jgi:hypothetical protein
MERGFRMRYFFDIDKFDIDDGSFSTRDDEGIEFSSSSQVREAAIQALPELVRDEWPSRDRRVFTVKVRTPDGRYIFHASLTLVADWLDGPGRIQP